MAYKEVNIADLQPGSYVVQVLQQKGEFVVKQSGWVRSTEAIDMLRKKGVLVVLIDPEKKLPQTSEPATPVEPQAETEPAAEPAVPHVSFSDEQPKAERALLQTAKVQLCHGNGSLILTNMVMIKPG